MIGSKPHEVLIVEDNPDHYEIVRRLLKKANDVPIKVTWIQDGQKCLNFLNEVEAEYQKTQKALPYIALLDLRLPGADGIEILRRIKSSPILRYIITIVISSSRHNRDIQSAYQNYTNSYLIKPADLGAFAELISQLKTYWVSCNQPPDLHNSTPILADEEAE
jgi:CheY-like chemotaxis protein